MGREFTANEPGEGGGSGFVMIPEDSIHRARLEKVEVREFDKKDKSGKVVKVRFFFVITAGDFEGRKLRGEVWGDFSPGSQFHSWAETLLGREIPVGMSIDVEDLEGLACDVSVAHEADYKDPAKKWAVVDELMPITAGFELSQPPF